VHEKLRLRVLQHLNSVFLFSLDKTIHRKRHLRDIVANSLTLVRRGYRGTLATAGELGNAGAGYLSDRVGAQLVAKQCFKKSNLPHPRNPVLMRGVRAINQCVLAFLSAPAHPA
jgi:hypothetical protein